MKFDVLIDGKKHSVEFAQPNSQSSRVVMQIDGREIEADAVRISLGEYSIILGGRSFEARISRSAAGVLVKIKNREFPVEVRDPRSSRRGRAGGVELEGQQHVTASMPGKVVRVLVTQGQKVEVGQGLLVVEAMKMQNEIRSPKSGVVGRLYAKEGQTVNSGEVLVVVA
jgi:biotin carboxyl carrier protein